jgi:hypothetical protein
MKKSITYLTRVDNNIFFESKTTLGIDKRKTTQTLLLIQQTLSIAESNVKKI